jgi:hypothetical protein
MFILRDTETTGDNFDELSGHHFVIKKFDDAPSTCFAHPMTQWLILHQSEQGFSDVMNIRTVTCYARRIEKDSMPSSVSFGFTENCFRNTDFLADLG